MRGTILWFDQRDGYGVIEGANGNEWYTDTSVFPHHTLALSGARVSFVANDSITHCRCAKDVALDLDHAAQLQYAIVEKLQAYERENPGSLREGAVQEALNKLGAIVALKEKV